MVASTLGDTGRDLCAVRSGAENGLYTNEDTSRGCRLALQSMLSALDIQPKSSLGPCSIGEWQRVWKGCPHGVCAELG